MPHRMSSKPACFKASKCSDGCDIPATGYQYETVSRCSTNHTAKKNLYESLEVMTTCIDTAYNICTLIYIFMYTNIYIYILYVKLYSCIYIINIYYTLCKWAPRIHGPVLCWAQHSPPLLCSRHRKDPNCHVSHQQKGRDPVGWSTLGSMSQHRQRVNLRKGVNKYRMGAIILPVAHVCCA